MLKDKMYLLSLAVIMTILMGIIGVMYLLYIFLNSRVVF